MLRVFPPPNGGSAWFPLFSKQRLTKTGEIWSLQVTPGKTHHPRGVNPKESQSPEARSLRFVDHRPPLVVFQRSKFRCRFPGQFFGTAIVVWEMGVVEGFSGCFGMSFELVFLKDIVCFLKKIQFKMRYVHWKTWLEGVLFPDLMNVPKMKME